jgi:hypothetical protein
MALFELMFRNNPASNAAWALPYSNLVALTPTEFAVLKGPE